MKFVPWIIAAAGLLAACGAGTPGEAAASSTTTPAAPPAAVTTTVALTSTTTTIAPTTTTTTGTTPTVRIAVAGDTGTGRQPQTDVAALMAANESEDEYAALVLLGDLIYPDGDPALTESVVLESYAETLDGGTILMPALGNHDIMRGGQDEILAILGHERAWYSQRVGNALVIILDSNVPDDPDQLAWLEAELAGSRDRWIIAAMHHPPYSAGSHGSSRSVREAFTPLFERYGVDLVLAGHDHDYQRSKPINGVTYVVSGGGAKLRPTGSADFTARSGSEYHYLELEISDEAISGTVFGLAGVIDEFTLQSDR